MDPVREKLVTADSVAVVRVVGQGEFDSARAAMAITAFLYGLMIVGRLAANRFDPSFFVNAGFAFCLVQQVPHGLTVDTRLGYDGQFYYRLALDPWTNQKTAEGITLDNPPYRQQRILYPALADALALGQARWVPTTMILVNYLAVCALGFTAGLFAHAFGRHALWGLIIPFFPGLILSIDRDLTEVLAISLATAAIYLLYRHCVRLGACTLALAILARETMLLLTAALLVSCVWKVVHRQARWSEFAWLLLPVLAFAACQSWVFVNWVSFGALSGFGNFGFPVAGVSAFVSPLLRRSALFDIQAYELMWLVGTILLAATALSGSAVSAGVKLAWAGYAILVSLFSQNIWVEDWAFMRATVELMVLSFLILLASRGLILSRLVFLAEFVIWGILAMQRTFMH